MIKMENIMLCVFLPQFKKMFKELEKAFHRKVIIMANENMKND